MSIFSRVPISNPGVRVGTGARLMEYDISRSLSDRSHTTSVCSLETAQLGGGINVQHSREYEVCSWYLCPSGTSLIGRRNVQSTIYSVSTHPTQPNLVITADDEGLVRLHDFRSPGAGALPSMEGLLVRNSEINDAQWCPAAGASHSFVVAQADGNVWYAHPVSLSYSEAPNASSTMY